MDSSYRRKEIPLAPRLADMINLSDKLLRMKYGQDPCINHAVLRDFNALFANCKRNLHGNVTTRINLDPPL